MAKEFGATTYYISSADYWSLSIARNIGLRRASGKYATTLDIDCIIEPEVMATVLDFHLKYPNSLILNRPCDLPEINLEDIKLPRDYSKLNDLCTYKRLGYGCLMSASKEWWFKCRGFDERLKIWGGEDDDMMNRAKRDNMKIIMLDTLKIPQTRNIHQWHPTKNLRVKASDWTFYKFTQVKLAVLKEESIIRNDEGWGCFPNK